MTLTRVYQQELKKTRAAVAHALEAHWKALPDYRDEQIDPFLDKVIPIVHAGQRRAASLTDAYMSRMLKTAPLGLDLDAIIGNVRNGVDSRTVYQRPFVTMWAAIATIGIEAAIIKGMNRLTSTAEMDVAMTARDASKAFGTSSGRVAGFVRVADPDCCDFCQSIDGAYVRSDSAAPLHNRCGCTLEPIGSDSSAADNSFDAITSGMTWDDAEIQEHGELGPVIVAKGDSFTGPTELNKPDYIES
jgi:hypothetical protein